MTNLLRRCENCVNGQKMPRISLISCEPIIPEWLLAYTVRQHQFVKNTEAETCSAFRLRDIGENRNV